MKNRNIRLYNIIFPIWFIPFFLWMRLPVIIVFGNFIIDSLVVLLWLKSIKNKKESIKINYKKSIRRVYGVGFLGDSIGLLFVALPSIFASIFWVNIPYYSPLAYKNINWEALSGIEKFLWSLYFGYENIWSFLWVIVSFFIAVGVIYYINYHRSFSKTTLTEKQKRKLALIIAIATAPYLFFWVGSTML